ncbi:GntR family transcriptional regulator [Paenibacillus eucommiae]|uniref:GntR family transcriptional regulator n=1 Tax=Paenibacillus eucommiae TaxID=1355755 RepID=A0ABS4J3E6_9BACL|nr:GntR family transcriptional regulator [Paenibacillus eucommiae]MBP1993736.1 GntR family transcriptional regulator [Paenibacillus eucommiae]
MAKVNRENRLPLYVQLKEVIIEKIDNKEWLPGDAIPTEMELQKIYKVSRITVRQALGELVSSGILTRAQGVGTFVASPKLEPIRPDLTGFTQDMNEKGHQVSSLILHHTAVKASEKLQRIFHIQPTAEVMKLERIRLVDGLPIGLHRTFLNTSITPQVELDKYDFTTDSLYTALAAEGVHLGGAEESVEASLADDSQASVLHISTGAPVLLLTRLTKLKDGTPYEYTQMVYRADKYKYTIKLS